MLAVAALSTHTCASQVRRARKRAHVACLEYDGVDAPLPLFAAEIAAARLERGRPQMRVCRFSGEFHRLDNEKNY